MNDKDRERHTGEMTDFRFKLVAELANPYLSSAERRRMIREKASVEHEVPGVGRRTLSEGCILKWLALYRKFGKEGLKPRSRRDTGLSRVLSHAEAALLLSHLEVRPELTATAVLRRLQESGRIRSNPSSSSLSRLVRSAGLERRRRIQAHAEEKTLKFEFFSPLECVQADGMYSVKIPDAKGKLRHAVLLAFLDDATRRVLHASFSFSENSLAFEAGIKHILAAHGRIGRLYCDHGSAFVSVQTRRILDTLGIILVHSQVGRPRGRGKIERYFRTAREQFFTPLDGSRITGIEELDRRFHSWLESEYHRSPHRGLSNRTPLEVWVEKAHLIVPLEPGLDLEQLFLHEATRRVHKDSTLTLDGALFEVPSDLIGERISLRYDPHRPPERRRLQIIRGGECIGEARLVDSYANAKVRRTDISRQVEITDIPDEEHQPSHPARRPLDNSLSATRLRWDQRQDDDTDDDQEDASAASPVEAGR
jgi:putative transposase